MRSCAATYPDLRKRVARPMATHDLQGRSAQALALLDPPGPTATPAPDLVNRDFTALAPNRLWVADSSRIPTGEDRCGWQLSAPPAPGGAVAGRPATGPIPSWCWRAGVRHLGPRPGRRPCPAQAHHHSDKGAQGGFNWWSQHLEYGGVDGTTIGLGCSGDGEAADAVAWAAAGSA